MEVKKGSIRIVQSNDIHSRYTITLDLDNDDRTGGDQQTEDVNLLRIRQWDHKFCLNR